MNKELFSRILLFCYGRSKKTNKILLSNLLVENLFNCQECDGNKASLAGRTDRKRFSQKTSKWSTSLLKDRRNDPRNLIRNGSLFMYTKRLLYFVFLSLQSMVPFYLITISLVIVFTCPLVGYKIYPIQVYFLP